MQRSESIDQLVTALAKAEGAFRAAPRDGANPHFGSAYATLTSILATVRAPLAENDLALVQTPTLRHLDPDVWLLEVETLVAHGASGQFLSSTFSLPIGSLTPQAVGSLLSYLRRYALTAVLAIASAGEDDDAEGAMPPTPRPKASKPARPKAAADVGVTERAIGRVAAVSRRVLAGGKEKLIVKLQNDGREFETWSTSLAAAAKIAQQSAVDVELTFRPGKFGLELLQLRDPNAPEPPL